MLLCGQSFSAIGWCREEYSFSLFAAYAFLFACFFAGKLRFVKFLSRVFVCCWKLRKRLNQLLYLHTWCSFNFVKKRIRKFCGQSSDHRVNWHSEKVELPVNCRERCLANRLVPNNPSIPHFPTFKFLPNFIKLICFFQLAGRQVPCLERRFLETLLLFSLVALQQHLLLLTPRLSTQLPLQSPLLIV